MTIHEAHKEQLKSIKNRSPKEKLSFFWEYYGLKTVALVAAVVAVVAFIVNLATKKEDVFTGVFFGASEQASADDYMNDFRLAAALDNEDYALSVLYRPDIRMDEQMSTEVYSYIEAFTAMVAAKCVDCFAGNPELFLYFGYAEYATDLRTVLTAEELSALEPYLYYIDAQTIRDRENAEDELSVDYSQYPDATKPELMTDPVPVGISLSAATDAFKESYPFIGEAVIGICQSSSYPENALAFLRYCLNDQ